MVASVLMIVHQPKSVTGRIGSQLEKRGYLLDVRCPLAGQPLPAAADLARYVGVVVFGGPMSANDDHLDGIRAELNWLPKVLAAGTPYLGVCLGAQLLARTLGAKVSAHTEKLAEIGYFPIQPTVFGCDLFAGLDCVYQWHTEGFELPAGAELLATGERFTQQAFRYGERALGIQFHPEVSAEMMERWLLSGAARLRLPGAQSPEQQRAGRRQHDAAVVVWLAQFLDYWLGESVSASISSNNK